MNACMQGFLKAGEQCAGLIARVQFVAGLTILDVAPEERDQRVMDIISMLGLEHVCRPYSATHCITLFTTGVLPGCSFPSGCANRRSR
jgi:hypothetical protein